MNRKIKIAIAAGMIAVSAFGISSSFAKTNPWPPTTAGKPTPIIPGMPPALAAHLANFDDLDFHVYTQQRWLDLHKSHAANIVVHYPDGHITKGIPDHIKELKFMWTFAPDNRITEHTVRFGTADGRWTAVMGYLDGTFTKPMELADGKVIQPTGKRYHLPMATLGHWNNHGTMDEEYLFWDTATLMKQIGVSN